MDQSCQPTQGPSECSNLQQLAFAANVQPRTEPLRAKGLARQTVQATRRKRTRSLPAIRKASNPAARQATLCTCSVPISTVLAHHWDREALLGNMAPSFRSISTNVISNSSVF